MDTGLLRHIERVLGTSVTSVRPVSGGDISAAYLLQFSKERLFCKVNAMEDARRMFMAEKSGLESLSSTGIIRTPEVLSCGSVNSTAYLLMEFIDAKSPAESEMEVFGSQLASLHLLPRNTFGWETDNFIGSLSQQNEPETNWSDFYVRKRLLPQIELAIDRKLLSQREIPGPEQMEGVLNNLCDGVRPSLLHGDLWGGNYLIAGDGTACLIDAAVYCGHSEVDLAMSRLFGGFPDSFYRGYDTVCPPDKGREARTGMYQLYYLLVHLNLFGNSYYSSVKQLFRRYFQT